MSKIDGRCRTWMIPFHTTGLFLYPLKIENLSFLDIFKGYRKRPVAWDGLTGSQVFIAKCLALNLSFTLLLTWTFRNQRILKFSIETELWIVTSQKEESQKLYELKSLLTLFFFSNHLSVFFVLDYFFQVNNSKFLSHEKIFRSFKSLQSFFIS